MKQKSYLFIYLLLPILLISLLFQTNSCGRKTKATSIVENPPKKEDTIKKEDPPITANTIFKLAKNPDNTYTILGLKGEYKDVAQVTIPVQIEGIDVSTIGERAFWESKVNTITFEPNSRLHTIEDEAFAYSTLERITLPNSLKILGIFIFKKCANLKEVVLGNQMETLSTYMFIACTSLNSITISNSIKKIEYAAFQGCFNLVSVNIDITHSQLNTIEAFAFHNCRNIKDINLPNNLTNIGENSFFNCVNLNSIHIGNNNTLKMKTPFANIPKLDIFCTATTPPIMGNDGLSLTTISTINIWVPADKVEEYKKAIGWSQYSKSIKSKPII